MSRSYESAVCAQRMAAAVTLSRSIIEDVAYALFQLRMLHLKLKEEKQQAIEAICHGDGVLSLPTGFGKSIIVMSFLSCLSGNLAAWMDCVTAVSPLSSSL